MIDLHVHSTFSDGSLTPVQLADEAAKAGLTAIALTDHDCVSGLDLFVPACEKHDIIPVPGVEISADTEHGTLHMLGYYIDADNKDLNDVLAKICDGREWRNDAIIKKLNDSGVNLSIDDVKAFVSEDVVGRPHIAMALQAKGYVNSKREAFDKYLAKGKLAYVDRFRLSTQDSIATILKAGGVPILAHPFTMGLNKKALISYVGELAEKGLKGIEVFYSEHSPSQVSEYLAIVKQFDLIATGGSDFHGSMNPAIQLGRGFGKLRVADEILEKLQACSSSIKACL